jgi:hypothetical protein
LLLCIKSIITKGFIPILRMVNFCALFTVRGDRTTKPNGVPAFDKRSHRPEYDNIVPDELIRRIIASPKAQEAVASILQKWEKVKEDLKAFTAFLKSINVDTNIIGALKAWSMIPAPDKSKISFLEFLLQPQYHHHFSAILGAEGILALNKEIDLRGYLHEVGVLCRLLKAHRIGSRDKDGDVDLMVKVDHEAQELDPKDLAELQKEHGINLDLTLFTLTHDGLSVLRASKGEPLVTQFLLSYNGIMPPLTPEQLQELVQVRIKGFWALFCHFDLIPFLIQLDKSEEEAKAIIARAQDENLTTEDMVAITEAFRQGRVTIPTEQRILDKWLKALNSLLKQYLHILALINGYYTAKKEELISCSGITGNELAFLKYVLYHKHQGAMTQNGVTDLLHLLLDDALLFTSPDTCQGPMWIRRLTFYAKQMRESKITSEVRGHEQPPVPLTADVLKLLFTHCPSHPVVKWFIAQIKAVKEKRDKKVPLSPFETSLMGVANQITPQTTDVELLSNMAAMTPKELNKLIPKDVEVLKSMPIISRETIEQMKGMLMTLDGVSALGIFYGDKVSFDDDKCIAIIITSENAKAYIVKTPSGIHALRDLSSAITQGGDVSTLILREEKDGKLIPVEIMNFYLNKKGEKVHVKEINGKVVHVDGTPAPQTTFEYDLLSATSPPLLERYAILLKTGEMPEEFRGRLSLDPMTYTPEINQGKWRDFIHYIIRWVTDTLTELSVLLHMLKSINAPQSLITRIEALKKTRDELFEAMKQPNAMTPEFMQEWVSMLHEVFALGLHTPDVLAFMQKNGVIEGLTKEQTEKIKRCLKAMYMNRLSFFKAIVFRLCQILYGLFVCIPEKKHMIYVKAELAEKVLPVLHEKSISIDIDTLVALLHRNYSLPNDIRLTSSLHMDFEQFVLGALVVLFPHFTGHEMCQRAIGEPVSWLFVAPVPTQEPPSVQESSSLVPTQEPPSVQGAPPVEELQSFVQKAKDRGDGKSWKITISIFLELYKQRRIDVALSDMLKNITGCDDILKAIAIVAKQVCEKSQHQRIEALIVLLMTDFFGHGKPTFIASIKAEKGAYDPTDDIKVLHERIVALHKKSSPAPTSVPVPVPVPVRTMLWKRYQNEVHAERMKSMRGVMTIAVYCDNKKVIIIVQNEGVFHISPLPEGTLCFMSYMHPALSWELLSSMTHELTTPEFKILGTDIPSTTSVPLALTEKKLSCQELYRESIVHLTSRGNSVIYGLGFGSLLQNTEEKRPMDKDVDFRIIISEGERKGIKFTASDGTKCDLSFTTLDNAKQQHEVLIAMLLGSSWLDASGNKIELFTLPNTLKECLQLLLPVVGKTIHHNSVKGKDDPIKTYQSVRLMVVLMQIFKEHQQYPHYNPLAFFPKEFNKDAFVEFLRTREVDCAMIVDLFTKAQYIITKGGLKAQDTKYQPIIEALPEPLKELMLEFKTITNTIFPNPTDKKGVNGVRTVLDYISKK